MAGNGTFNINTYFNATITNLLAETAAKISLLKFEWRYITLVFFNVSMFGVDNFLKYYDKSIIISTGLGKPYYAENTDQYVIFGNDISDLTNMLNWMQLQRFDNTGRYVIICESNDEDCDETEAVNTFWYHKITNVIFLKYSEDEVVAYTYFFNESNCAMSNPVKMVNLDFCLENLNKCDLYPEKFNNLHGCPLIASTFEQPPYMSLQHGQPKGSDGGLLTILAKSLNSTLQVMTPRLGDGWGTKHSNGTWFGSLGDVYYDYANISITSAAITISRYSSFQLSYNYNYVTVGWVTSPTKLEPYSLKLVHPFQPKTHLAIDIVFILIIIIAIIIRSKLWEKFMQKPEVSSQTVIFRSWRICMGMPALKLPKKPFFLYMTFLWIWYTFLVRTMYQASLINSLKSNKFSSNIDTVEEAIRAKYKIAGGPALRDYYVNYPLVYNTYIGLNTTAIVKTLKRMSKNENEKCLVAVNLESVNAFLQKHGGSLHIVNQKIVVSPTSIYFKKFSPLADPINLVLRKLFEAGIPDKLYRNYVHTRKKRPKKVDNKEPLRTEHYNGCYVILFLGWAVSAVTFLCEFCFGVKNKL